MSDEHILCEEHGERGKAFVCNHLLAPAVGQGFNRNDPTPDNPFPDAWCDDCEKIRAAYDGWNEESEKLTSISLLCSGCYSRSRIRNTRTAVTLDDLADMRWKCGTCEEWHTGACFDFGHDFPAAWTEEHRAGSRKNLLMPWRKSRSMLDADRCTIDDEYFFVRGNIHLPILGTDETFRWGVWGSLSRENFKTLQSVWDDERRKDLPPMFSWLTTNIADYRDTLNLKMYAHIQAPGERPHFELEDTDHSLSQEFHHGITPARIKEIMLRRLKQ